MQWSHILSTRLITRKYPISLEDLVGKANATIMPIIKQPVVAGHAGKLLFGFLQSSTSPIVLMVGRTQ